METFHDIGRSGGLTGDEAGPILPAMKRRILLYGVPGLLLVLVSAGLLRRCGASARASVPSQSRMSFLPDKKAAPKTPAAPKKPGLVAPRLLNLDDLQTNIRKYYPEAEHAAGKEGRVMLAMVVGADGSLREIRVETSGGAAFDEAAKKVALEMRFAPAEKAGKPVAVEISEGIEFQFDGK